MWPYTIWYSPISPGPTQAKTRHTSWSSHSEFLMHQEFHTGVSEVTIKEGGTGQVRPYSYSK